MNVASTHEHGPLKPLRLWPGVVAVALQWLAWLVLPAVVPQWSGYGFLAALYLGLIVAIWWLFFSRALWSERLGAIVLMVVAVAVTTRLVHLSISNALMGYMLFVYSVPALSLALVGSLVVSRRLSTGLRRASMAAAIVIACATFTVIRTDGITGEGDSDLEWRWTPTAEQRLLAQAGNEPVAPPSAPAGAPPPEKSPAEPTAPAPAAAKTPEERVPAPAAAKPVAEWPGFRGPRRDGVVRGVRIETDWSKSPPVQLWRRPIGPGWSSFAVQGDVIYTQEQRGDDEVVSSYRLTTGEPVWRHRDAARFWESNGGAGPRGTPTLSNGRVFALGATGILNALDASNGAVVWSRNAVTDTGVTIPGWGIASSPLVINDVVIVAASGRLAAYDVPTGKPRWLGESGGGGYSSPHFATIDGVPQVLLIRGSRTISVAPADGKLLWDHTWERAAAIVQPALVGERDVLIGLGEAMGMGGNGIRRISVARGPDGWKVEERWTSRGLKPYFNDYVVHEGHAFGFDGTILSCISLENGERQWKGGRYGAGQMLLLSDQDVLLVVSEEGELALVRAAPDQFSEVARFPALEDKTWNHPVLVGDVLLVRNGEEMAAFRLSLADR
jgi:outer membrane protein assembly factor BamB